MCFVLGGYAPVTDAALAAVHSSIQRLEFGFCNGHPVTSWLVPAQALYEKFESEGRARDQIDARKLWFAIMDAQVWRRSHPLVLPLILHVCCILNDWQPGVCLHCARSA